MRNMEDSILVDSHIAAGVRFIEYQPGNGSRYGVVFTDLSGLTQAAKDRIGCDDSSVLVSIIGFRATSIVVKKNGGLLHYNYVAEKMNLSYGGDVAAVTRLIGYVTGRSVALPDYAETEDE